MFANIKTLAKETLQYTQGQFKENLVDTVKASLRKGPAQPAASASAAAETTPAAKMSLKKRFEQIVAYHKASVTESLVKPVKGFRF
jgi:hypothetical protein